MKGIKLLFVFGFWLLASLSSASAQTSILAIVNGAATDLPKPTYPPTARNYCAEGKVEIEVKINRNGRVVSSKIISGNPLLTSTSLAAVRKARFRPYSVITRGIVVYDFDGLSKCLSAGVVNRGAQFIPKPQFGGMIHHLKITADHTISVQIVVDQVKGTVISAKAVSGHPLLRAAFERSAMGAKFSPVAHGYVNVKAVLTYILKPNGNVEF